MVKRDFLIAIIVLICLIVFIGMASALGVTATDEELMGEDGGDIVSSDGAVIPNPLLDSAGITLGINVGVTSTQSNSNSVVYWIKKKNALFVSEAEKKVEADKLLKQIAEDSEKRKETLEEEASADVGKLTVRTGAAKVATKVNSISWKSVPIDNTGFKISFPKTNFDGKEGALTIWFHQGSIVGKINKWVHIFDSGIEIDCDKDRAIFEKIGNLGGFVVKNAILIGGFEEEETCRNVFKSDEPYATITLLSLGNSKYTVKISSPLIPDSCPSIVTHKGEEERELIIEC